MKSSAFEDFSEAALEALDFARCQRPDGSYYGTSGQCRKGTKVDAKEKESGGKGKKKETGAITSKTNAADAFDTFWNDVYDATDPDFEGLREVIPRENGYSNRERLDEVVSAIKTKFPKALKNIENGTGLDEAGEALGRDLYDEIDDASVNWDIMP